MANVIVEVSKFLMMILFALYTFECFAAFRGRISPKKRERIFKRQIIFMAEGDQSWVFIGRTDAEAQTQILWPPHAKS